jgi:hypothetical protein
MSANNDIFDINYLDRIIIPKYNIDKNINDDLDPYILGIRNRGNQCYAISIITLFRSLYYYINRHIDSYNKQSYNINIPEHLKKSIFLNILYKIYYKQKINDDDLLNFKNYFIENMEQQDVRDFINFIFNDYNNYNRYINNELIISNYYIKKYIRIRNECKELYINDENGNYVEYKNLNNNYQNYIILPIYNHNNNYNLQDIIKEYLDINPSGNDVDLTELLYIKNNNNYVIVESSNGKISQCDKFIYTKLPYYIILYLGILSGNKYNKNIQLVDIITFKYYKYKIKSVILHHGTDIKSGHYTNLILINNIWYHINDDNVTPIQGDLNTVYYSIKQRTNIQPYIILGEYEGINNNEELILNQEQGDVIISREEREERKKEEREKEEREIAEAIALVEKFKKDEEELRKKEQESIIRAQQSKIKAAKIEENEAESKKLKAEKDANEAEAKKLKAEKEASEAEEEAKRTKEEAENKRKESITNKKLIQEVKILQENVKTLEKEAELKKLQAEEEAKKVENKRKENEEAEKEAEEKAKKIEDNSKKLEKETDDEFKKLLEEAEQAKKEAEDIKRLLEETEKNKIKAEKEVENIKIKQKNTNIKEQDDINIEEQTKKNTFTKKTERKEFKKEETALKDSDYNDDYGNIKSSVNEDTINSENFFKIICDEDNEKILKHITISLIELLSDKKRRTGFKGICDIIIEIIRNHNKTQEIDCCMLEKEKEIIYEIIKYNETDSRILNKFDILLEEINVKIREICKDITSYTIASIENIRYIITYQMNKYLSNTIDYNILNTVLKQITTEDELEYSLLENIKNLLARYGIAILYDSHFKKKIEDNNLVRKLTS